MTPTLRPPVRTIQPRRATSSPKASARSTSVGVAPSPAPMMPMTGLRVDTAAGRLQGRNHIKLSVERSESATVEVREVRADRGEGPVDGAGGHGAAFQPAELGGRRPLSDWMNSRLTSGLSAPVSRCRRTCRRTASLRFASARRRPITSTVTSHGPQSEQSSCTVAAKGRTDPVRPQKRHTAINESLTRLTRSPLLTAFGGAGRISPSLLKNVAIPEVHATRGSYSRRLRRALSRNMEP